MTASFWHEGHPGGRVNFGVMGGAKTIPANYRQRFILVAASSINKVNNSVCRFSVKCSIYTNPY